MPYIEQQYRTQIDKQLKPLIQEIQHMTVVNAALLPGLIAYCLMKMLLHTTVRRYHMLAEVVGNVELTKLEFVRKVVAPYEDGKRLENGDVDAD